MLYIIKTGEYSVFCSADHVQQDKQPYPVDPYSCCMCGHTYIHTYIHTFYHTYILPYIHTAIHTYYHKYYHTTILPYIHTIPPREDQCEWHRMTRMTGPDCVVMCNLINTYIHTHTYIRGIE